VGRIVAAIGTIIRHTSLLPERAMRRDRELDRDAIAGSDLAADADDSHDAGLAHQLAQQSDDFAIALEWPMV
jgi:hypothetical protein